MEFAVSERKIVHYLLSNSRKSGFFLPLGYSVDQWTRLRDDLLKIAAGYPLLFERETEYGQKYSVRGEVEAPDGRVVGLMTIWMIEPSAPGVLKLLTAYPR